MDNHKVLHKVAKSCAARTTANKQGAGKNTKCSLFTTSLNCDVFCAGAWLIPEDHTNDTPSYKNFRLQHEDEPRFEAFDAAFARPHQFQTFRKGSLIAVLDCLALGVRSTFLNLQQIVFGVSLQRDRSIFLLDPHYRSVTSVISTVKVLR